MKNKKLLFLLPVALLVLSGCDLVTIKSRTKSGYFSTKSFLLEKAVNPGIELLKDIKNGDDEISYVNEARLFKSALNSTNASFDLVATIGGETTYVEHKIAGTTYKQVVYSSNEGLTAKDSATITSESVVVSNLIYNKSGNEWTKQIKPESWTSITKFDDLFKTHLGKSLVNYVVNSEVTLKEKTYSISGVDESFNKDPKVYESYKLNWMLSFVLNDAKTILDSFNFVARINYKLVGSSESVGETMIFNGKCTSIGDVEISIPKVSE